MNKKILVGVIIILVLAGSLGGWYYFSNKKLNQATVEPAKVNPLDFLVFEVKDNNLSEFKKDREFERFNKAKGIILNNVDQGLVLNDDRNFYAWLEAALAQKIIGDYDRATGIWKWFTDAYPHNSTSPVNLGSFYSTNVVDNKQAEKYFKIAMEREKNKFHIYYNFYKLYRYNFKDEQKAIDVLKTGLENNPDNKNFVNELVDYLVILDRKDEAGRVIDQWLVNHPQDYSLRTKLK